MTQEFRILLISILIGSSVAGWFLVLWALLSILIKEIKKKK